MSPTYPIRASNPDDPSADSRSVRERLVAAAMALVQREGLQNLSQARVASAAGLRQSHLTYYFPTRKDLIKALVRNIHEELKVVMDSEMFPGDGGRVSVGEVRAFFVRRLSDPYMARLMLALMNAADETPSLRRWLGEFDADLIEHLRKILICADLHPSEDELALLHASFVGAAILGAQATADPEAGCRRVERLVRLAFDHLVGAVTEAGQRDWAAGGGHES